MYQEQVLRFGKWARETYEIKTLAALEVRADELACVYLRKQLQEQKSASTLQTIRAALRMLFGNRQLAREVTLPKRERRKITRSRGVKKHDRQFQPKNWLDLLHFLQATGLRRDEVKMLKAGDICGENPAYGGRVTITVRSGKGGKQRVICIEAEQVEEVLKRKEGCRDDERVFPRIPSHLDVHAYRRGFAQERYLRHAPGYKLPSPEKALLGRKDYDAAAAQLVTESLGHTRRSIILTHYIR